MEKKDYLSYCFTVSLMDHFYWTFGSVLGALLGSAISFDTKGVDFVLTALFISILVQQWTESEDKRPAVLGLVITIACRVIFGAGSFLIKPKVEMK